MAFRQYWLFLFMFSLTGAAIFYLTNKQQYASDNYLIDTPSYTNDISFKTQNYSQESGKIINFIVTKLPQNRALIRIYGENPYKRDLLSFPLKISYFSSQGELLAEDHIDLLANTKKKLKKEGKINSEVTVTYPQGTFKIEVDPLTINNKED